jgi:hypothetical protein
MRTSFTLLALSLVLFAACDGNSPASGDSGGGAGTGGSAASGAGATAGALSAASGAPNSAGKASSSSGGVASGVGGAGSGAPSSAGAAAGGSHAGAGAPTGHGGASATGGGGVAAGGTSGAPSSAGGALGRGGGTTGAGGASAAGAGVGGAGVGTACSRDALKSAVTAYFTALAAHDASTLPLADSVKFTENGKVLMLNQGLWLTAGAVKGSFSAYDTDTCNAATQAVVPDGNTDIPFALRLKLEAQKITEIETIAVRDGDYKVSGSSFASDTKALLASVDSVHWEDPVPAAMQNTRDEISAWVDKYFRDFPNGVCNTTSSCKRIENGGGSFSCSAGASCMMGTPSGKPAITPRLILVDTETGLGVGYDLFQGADDDTHMFKMYGGQVYAVSAILGGATSTGWE